MKTFKRVSLISAITAAFAMTVAVTVPAMAQASNSAKPQAQAQTTAPTPQLKQDEHRQHREAPAFSKPAERVEARLTYQRTALKITPQQQTQWEHYATYVRKQAQEMEKHFTAMGPRGSRPATPPNAIQRLEQQQAMLSQASSSLNERIAVQKPLYAALSPEQQKVADQVLNPRRGGMGGKGDHRGQGDRGGHRFGHTG